MKVRKAVTLPLIGSVTSLFAAEVPEGAKLAPQQILRIDLGFKPENVHPYYSSNLYENWVVRDLFEGLVTLNAKGEQVPGAAERWEASDNYKTWIFHLQPNAHWSNGDPVTAEDFVYGMHALLMSDSRKATHVMAVWKIQNAEAVKKGVMPQESLGIEALGPQILKIKLQAPDPLFPQRCGLEILPFHPEEVPMANRTGDICLPVVDITNGPFCNLVYVTNLKYQAERNPYYWDHEKTIIERVEYYFTEDLAIRQERFLQGQMDVVDLVSHASGLGLQYQTKFGNRFWQIPSANEISIALNVDKKPFNNPKVREAFNIVIDRDQMLKYLKQKNSLPVHSKLHPAVVNRPLIEPEWVSWPYEKRVEAARKSLQGLRLPTITLMTSLVLAKTKLPEYLVKTWKETLGVEVHVLEMDFQGVMQKSRNKDFMMHLRGSTHTNAKFAWSMLSSFIEPASKNSCSYHNPKLAALLEAALSPGFSNEERENALLEANCLLASESPVFSLYYKTRDYLVQPYIGGIDIDNLDGCFRAKDLYLVETSTASSK